MCYSGVIPQLRALATATTALALGNKINLLPSVTAYMHLTQHDLSLIHQCFRSSPLFISLTDFHLQPIQNPGTGFKTRGGRGEGTYKEYLNGVPVADWTAAHPPSRAIEAFAVCYTAPL